jgi:hypothetical protein
MGVQILHVTEVDDVIPNGTNPSYGGEGEWFRYYANPTGAFQALVAGRSIVLGSGVTNITVTQLCIGNVNWNNC